MLFTMKMMNMKKPVKSFVNYPLLVHESTINDEVWEISHCISEVNLGGRNPFIFERNRLEEALMTMNNLIQIGKERGLDWWDYTPTDSRYHSVIQIANDSCYEKRYLQGDYYEDMECPF